MELQIAKKTETKTPACSLSSLAPGQKIVVVEIGKSLAEKSLDLSSLDKIRADEYWKSKVCNCSRKKCLCEVLDCKENISSNVKGYNDNSFFESFLLAYNNHQSILLSPDDMAIAFNASFNKFMDEHAEEVRKSIVSHEGKKKLTVVTWKETSETDWQEFFDLLFKKIKKNTTKSTADAFCCNYTTTGLVEKTVSTVQIMGAVKSFFDYVRLVPCCGIRNVYFIGELEDWNKLLAKVKQTKKYNVGNWKSFVQGYEKILQEFLATYQGNPDLTFWDKIMNTTSGREGSGSTDYVSGWILKLFYGIHTLEKVKVDDIPVWSSDVEVQIDNKITGVVSVVRVLAGFSGLAFDKGVFRPQVSYAVIKPNPKTTEK